MQRKRYIIIGLVGYRQALAKSDLVTMQYLLDYRLPGELQKKQPFSV